MLPASSLVVAVPAVLKIHGGGGWLLWLGGWLWLRRQQEAEAARMISGSPVLKLLHCVLRDKRDDTDVVLQVPSLTALPARRCWFFPLGADKLPPVHRTPCDFQVLYAFWRLLGHQGTHEELVYAWLF